MSRQATTKAYNTFIRGLHTEATALTFPENASLDEANFILNRDGSRQRRLGMDYESSYTLNDTSLTPLTFAGAAVTSYKWDNVDNNAATTIGVIQVGTALWFTDLTTSAPSSSLLNQGRSLTISSIGHTQVHFAAVDGRLVVTTGEADPIYLAYDRDNDVVTSGTIDIKIRDLQGVEDYLDVTDNPATLSDLHHYNLLNQGWDSEKIEDYVEATGYFPNNAQIWHVGKDSSNNFDPDELDKVDLGTSPAPRGRHVIDAFTRGADRLITSAADPVVTIKANPLDSGKWSISYDGGDSWETKDDIELGYINTTILSVEYGPNGIYDLPRDQWSLLSSTETGPAATDKLVVTGWFFAGLIIKFSYASNLGTSLSLPIDKENGHLICAEAHAGRIFYAGVHSSITDADDKSPNYSSWVFFSAVVKETAHLSMCHQESDPTSEEFSDLLDTDGGVIPIAGAANIMKLVSIGDSLLVLAENGVWEIKGGETGFLATEYSVHKVSNVGVIGGGSVVEVETTVFYWSDGGIYLLAPDKVTGRYAPHNITETTIQSFVNEIPAIAKEFMMGHYDATSKNVMWLYNDSDAYDGVSYKYKYNKELIFNTTIKAFYKNELDVSAPFVADYVQTPGFLSVDYAQSVVVGNDQVEASAVEVDVTTTIRGRGESTTKYLTFVEDGDFYFTLSHYNDSTFTDWVTHDGTGVDYSSYLITGYELFGDIVRRKQVPYLFAYFNRTEDGYDGDDDQLAFTHPSSCFIQSQWAWTDSAASGRWGNPFQAYRLKRVFMPASISDPFDYGHSTIVTKSKLRGKGEALSLYIYSETGKDMHLLGWAVSAVGAGIP